VVGGVLCDVDIAPGYVISLGCQCVLQKCRMGVRILWMKGGVVFIGNWSDWGSRGYPPESRLIGDQRLQVVVAGVEQGGVETG